MTEKCPCKVYQASDIAWMIAVSFGVGACISVGFFTILKAVFG